MNEASLPLRAVLLVEDNPDDADLALMAFEANEIPNRVVVAHDGVEALDYLWGTGVCAGRSTRDVPALVLLDLKLPKMDGFEVLRRMRADPRTAMIPVVVLTSSKEEEDILTAYGAGCNSYIRKPVSFDQFVKAIGHLALYWLSLNEPPFLR